MSVDTVAIPQKPVKRTSIQQQGKVAGLRDFDTPTLEAVERRRLQLAAIAAIILVGLAMGMSLLTIAQSSLAEHPYIPFDVIRILFVGFVSVVALYLIDKEQKLQRLTKSLVDERVLSAALSNRLKELSLLSELGKTLNRFLEVDEVLDRVLESALDLLEAPEGSIMLLEPSTDALRVACAKTSSRHLVEGAVVKMGGSVAGWVAQKREPLLLTGNAPKDMFDGFQTKDRQIPSAICVPLISQDELYGVLNVNAGPDSREFTEYDLRAVQLFAEHAALAIRNANSFDREKQAVARLEEIDRLKSDFLASISHELKTPLTSIIGSATTMRQRGDRLTEGQHDDFLNVIERQGLRLVQLVEQLLSAARIESGAPVLRREALDLGLVARQVVTSMKAGGAPNPMSVEGPPHLEMFGDPAVVEQVLTNLVDNAVKYSDGKGNVVIRLSDSPGEVCLEVSDVGRGIPSVELETIFDRFKQIDQSMTRKASGVGLGLYIVKNLVEASGGGISVRSEIGEGSSFRVVFPKRRESK